MCLKIGLITTVSSDGRDTEAVTLLLAAGRRAVVTLTIVDKGIYFKKYALIAATLGDEAKCFVKQNKSAAV